MYKPYEAIMWCFAPFGPGDTPYWYEGTAIGTLGDEIYIKAFDGGRFALPAECVRRPSFWERWGFI